MTDLVGDVALLDKLFMCENISKIMQQLLYFTVKLV